MSQTQVERSFIKDKEKLLYETWRLHTPLAPSNGNNVITANLERADDSFTGQVNGAMTESSGVFTFPYTGFFRIGFWPYYYSNSQGSSIYMGANINVTENNGTNYYDLTEQYDAVTDSSYHGAVSANFIFDVTDVSTHKVRFNCFTQNDVTLSASTSTNKTYMIFEYLGDT